MTAAEVLAIQRKRQPDSAAVAGALASPALTLLVQRKFAEAEDVWHQPYVQIPQEYLVSNFQFRFRAKMSGSDEDPNLDNVQLVATSLAVPNLPPVAVDDSATTDEDTAVTIDVLANDSDGDDRPDDILYR